jgi:ABC-type multidrug transport system ATPase subunit
LYVGAGKTTLLNFLSGREISKNLEKLGNIYVNGKNRNSIRGFSAISAYVQQDDILF